MLPAQGSLLSEARGCGGKELLFERQQQIDHARIFLTKPSPASNAFLSFSWGSWTRKGNLLTNNGLYNFDSEAGTATAVQHTLHLLSR